MAGSLQTLGQWDPLAGTRPQQVNWGQTPGATAMPVQNPWSAPAPQDVASANAAAQAQQDQAAAAAKAAAGGIQAQKMDEASDAMANRYRLAPQADAIQRQFQTADAIRNMGAAQNTGSRYGAAPNWAGALANVVGAYKGKQMQDAAQASANALGGQYADIASQYFRNAPTSYF